jgi:hypothetical protein
VGLPPADLHGTSPDGTPVDVDVDVGGTRLVLLFLTSSCFGCRAIWAGLAASGGPPPEGGTSRVVVVTPSPSTESARTVAGLAPLRIPVLMSSEAWHAYGVTRAPWCVVVAGGEVVMDSPAPATWAELAALLGPEGR